MKLLVAAFIVGLLGLGLIQPQGGSRIQTRNTEAVWGSPLTMRSEMVASAATVQPRITLRGAETSWEKMLSPPSLGQAFVQQQAQRIVVRRAESIWSSTLVRLDFQSTSTPNPTPPPTATLAPAASFRLAVNGIIVRQGQSFVNVENGNVTLSQAPGLDSKFPSGTILSLAANPNLPGASVTWGGVDNQQGAGANILMLADRFVTVSITLPTPTLHPTATPRPTPTSTLVPTPTRRPTITMTPIPTVTPTPRQEGVVVDLHMVKTVGVVGEEIPAVLSIVNSIAKPEMTVKLILTVPSGMSVSGEGLSDACSGGLCSAVYRVAPGKQRPVDIQVIGNQPGEFTVKGDLEWFFGDPPSDPNEVSQIVKELPVQINARSEETEPNTSPRSVPGCNRPLSNGNNRWVGLPDLALLLGAISGLVMWRRRKQTSQ